MLLEGYDPDRASVDELAWRLPFYEIGTLFDAVVAHRLGRRVDASVEVAMGYVAQQAG